MDLKITPSGQTIVKPTALGPGANTDTKLLIYGLFQKGRVLAQDGRLAFFGDATREGGRVDIDDLVADLVEELASDARALGCEAETRRALAIIREGTSADWQVDLFRLRRLEGDTEEEALHSVVDLLLAETRNGLGQASR